MAEVVSARLAAVSDKVIYYGHCNSRKAWCTYRVNGLRGEERRCDEIEHDDEGGM